MKISGELFARLCTCCAALTGAGCGSSFDTTTAYPDSDGGAATGAVSDGGAAGSTSGLEDSGVDDGSAESTGTDTSNSEPSDMTGMTAAHNAARAAVDPPASPALPNMQWVSTIAAKAQSYSAKCNFAHSGASGLGENIYASTGATTPAGVVASWVSEKKYYDYSNSSCSKVCGHYTQVVWRDSTQLGCGHTTCASNSPFGSGKWELWVCNYQPPGNWVGQRPY